MLEQMISFLAANVRTATPLLLGGLGLLFNARSGVQNIGGEGMMLVGAVMGVVGAYWTGNAYAGALFAGAAGMLMSLIFAFLVVSTHADQVVIGAGLNIFGLGVSTTIARAVFGLNTAPPKIESFSRIALPGLSKIPVLGEMLFDQSIFTYFALLMVPILYVFLFRTPAGLKVRATGEHPRACDTMGISVYKVRYACILFGGLMCGISGASLSLGAMNGFTENMVAGRGYMAMAAVTLGRWNPLGILFATLLFGAGEALQYRLQAADTPIAYQFLQMLPYLMTLVVVSGLAGKTKKPAATGMPFVKE